APKSADVAVSRMSPATRENMVATLNSSVARRMRRCSLASVALGAGRSPLVSAGGSGACGGSSKARGGGASAASWPGGWWRPCTGCEVAQAHRRCRVADDAPVLGTCYDAPVRLRASPMDVARRPEKSKPRKAPRPHGQHQAAEEANRHRPATAHGEPALPLHD